MVRKGIWLVALAWTTLVGREAAAGREESFVSAATGGRVDYTLLLPANYDTEPTARFPVVYLLHGRGDDMRAWRPALERLARAMAAGELPPLILVAPDAPWSRRAGYYIDSEFGGSDRLPSGARIESALTDELVAHIDATYRTRAEHDGRIVAGYSMGGYGALRYTLAHPGKFGAAVVLSPAVYLPSPPPDSSTREFGAFGRGAVQFDESVYAAKNYPALLAARTAQSPALRFFIAVGDDERALPDAAQAAHDLDLEAHTLYNHLRRAPGIRAELRVVDGGHNWRVWQPMLLEGLRHLFGAAQPAAQGAAAR